YDDPDILGATGSSSAVGPYSDLRQRLINRASTNSETELYNALPDSSVPIELNEPRAASRVRVSQEQTVARSASWGTLSIPIHCSSARVMQASVSIRHIHLISIL